MLSRFVDLRIKFSQIVLSKKLFFRSEINRVEKFSKILFSETFSIKTITQMIIAKNRFLDELKLKFTSRIYCLETSVPFREKKIRENPSETIAKAWRITFLRGRAKGFAEEREERNRRWSCQAWKPTRDI